MRRRRQVRVMVAAQVQRNRDPRQQAILNVVRQLHILHKRVIVRRGLLQHPPVQLPRCELDGVGVVRVGGLDGVDERVVEVQLTDVQRRAGRVRVVGLQCHVGLHHDVQVRHAAFIVAGEQGVEARHALFVVSELDAA